MEILPGVHRLSFRHRDRWLYVYLLVGDWLVLVDTGTAAVPEEVILPALHSLGIDPARRPFLALNTHADADHSGGNGELRLACPQALLLCHDRDRSHIEDHERLWRERYTGYLTPHGLAYPPGLTQKMRASMGRAVPVDLVLTGGETIRIRSDWELRILFTPGHTPGHVAVHDLRHRTAYIGDAALGRGIPAAEGDCLALPPSYEDVEAYAGTARALRSLDLDILCPSHFPLLRAEAIPRFLDETEDWIARTDEAILATLREVRAPIGMKALIAAVTKPLGGWPEEPALTLAMSLTAHLERLERLGQITRLPDERPPAWELRS
ncbi:MAG TPA: MBL fold metallo-hydrolase [Candidatus Methylomirabilis sp.]|nr:MBL fold metallo-hydrolase [Candidatus Methylomirabilis sp.]HSC71662.1 MBL fold metallo-hydrolase [Candidatus Methylomirabilis sp.]